MSTFTDLAGIKLETKTDGISVLPTLMGKDNQKEHDYLCWEFFSQNGKQAVRMGKWKGVHLNLKDNPNNPIELYFFGP